MKKYIANGPRYTVSAEAKLVSSDECPFDFTSIGFTAYIYDRVTGFVVDHKTDETLEDMISENNEYAKSYGEQRFVVKLFSDFIDLQNACEGAKHLVMLFPLETFPTISPSSI